MEKKVGSLLREKKLTIACAESCTGGLLKDFGAVSEETAREMSANVRKLFSTDIGIGITGIAGPGGGSSEKPVGTVYISVATKDNVSVKKFNFSGSRTEIKNKSVQAAFEMLEKIL